MNNASYEGERFRDEAHQMLWTTAKPKDGLSFKERLVNNLYKEDLVQS